MIKVSLVHLGLTLEEFIAELEIPLKDLALEMKLNENILNEIIQGKIPIDSKTTSKIEKSLGIPKNLLMPINYDQINKKNI